MHIRDDDGEIRKKKTQKNRATVSPRRQAIGVNMEEVVLMPSPDMGNLYLLARLTPQMSTYNCPTHEEL